MKVLIKEFQSGGLSNSPSTIHFSCDIKLSPEYFQTLFWDSRDRKNLDEHAEHLGEMVKKEIIQHIKDNQ
jgi:hypothetical protein